MLDMLMTKEPSLDELWETAESGDEIFVPRRVAGLPEAARRYLEYAIEPGTPLATTVRLRMHGEIKLQGWYPFSAEQVIRWDRGMIWRATVRMHGMPVRGFDRLLDGEGEMRWKLLGMFPVMTAAGPDITRSAAGRVEAESVWLPSVLCGDDVSWTSPDRSHAQASFAMLGEKAELALTLADRGCLASLKLRRWGNPEGGEFHYADFGGLVEREGTFDGYTIPTHLRIGWHFGTDHFEPEGELIRVRIDEARYR